MADQEANVNIKLALQQQALQQGKQGVKDLEKQFTDLKAKIQDTGKSADSALVGMVRSSTGLNAELADTIKQTEKLGGSVEKLKRIGSAFSGIGLGGLGSFVSQAGDIVQLGKSAQEGLGFAAVGMGELIAVAGPLALAAGGVALEFKQLTDTIEAGRKEIEKAENSLVDYYKVTATGTSESIRKQIADQRIIQNANESTLAINQKKINDLVNAQGLSPQMTKTITDEIAKAIRTPNSPLTNTDLNLPVALLPGIHSLIEESAKLATASKDAGEKIDKYTIALNDNSVKANDAAQAFLDFQKMSRGSSDSVKAHVQDLKDEQDALKVQIAYLQASGDTSEATSQKLRDLTDEYNRDGDAITNLTKIVLPLVQAREKEAQNAKDLQKALDDVAAANAKAAEDMKLAQRKRDEDIQKIHEDDAQKRLEIERQYGQTLIDIAEKAVQASEDSLRKLEQKREDINTAFGRDAEKVDRENALKDIEERIKAQRQERDDLRSHLQNLHDIQRQFDADQQDAAMDRNFAQLFKLQQQKNRDTERENEKFLQQQQARTQALAEEKNDIARQRAFERNERLIAYRNQLADARLAYQRELEQQSIAKQRELTRAAQAVSQQYNLEAQATARLLQLRQQAYNREVQMVQATEAAKIRIFQDALTRLYGSGDASYSGRRTTYTGSRVNFADGGGMAAGQAGIVNEPWSSGNEGFSTGGKLLKFPGFGMFIPSQSGTVNKNAGATVTQHFEINGARDPKAVADEIDRRVIYGLKKVGIG